VTVRSVKIRWNGAVVPRPQPGSRSGEVIAAVNIAIPWSPEAITELVGQHAPALQAAARQIAAQVI
jgi:hypothetical protein